MRLLCSLGWHRPSPHVIPNEGRLFSRCTACNADLIMVGRGWRTAPKGYQVVWKQPTEPPPTEAPLVQEKPTKAGKASAGASAASRRRGERRVAKGKDLPAKLAGKDRRRSGNRRKGFGKKPDEE